MVPLNGVFLRCTVPSYVAVSLSKACNCPHIVTATYGNLFAPSDLFLSVSLILGLFGPPSDFPSRWFLGASGTSSVVFLGIALLLLLLGSPTHLFTGNSGSLVFFMCSKIFLRACPNPQAFVRHIMLFLCHCAFLWHTKLPRTGNNQARCTYYFFYFAINCYFCSGAVRPSVRPTC